MDLWRAAKGYGHADGALKEGLPPTADTFVLLGTCHAGMRAPFSVKTKTFETPFGPLACDREWVKGLAERSRFDVFGDEYQHKAEHAIEFQAVFLSCGTSWDQSAPRALASYPSLGQSSARLHHDAQHVDPDEGSIVSHASVSFIR